MIACGALNPERPKLMMPKLKKNFVSVPVLSTDVDMARVSCAAIICPRGERSGRKSKKDGQQ